MNPIGVRRWSSSREKNLNKTDRCRSKLSANYVMRKFAIATFAILYLFLAVTWPVQHSFSHHSFSRNSHHLGKAERDCLLYEKKLLEKQLVADIPGEASAPSLASDRHTALVAYDCQPALYSRPSPSRAPPLF